MTATRHPVFNRQSAIGNRQSPKSAYVLLDLLTGLIIVALLATILATAATARGRATNRLADQLRASRLAEQAATQLQRHQPATIPDAQIKIDPLPHTPPTPNTRWVTITLTLPSGASAQLTSLVPSDSPP